MHFGNHNFAQFPPEMKKKWEFWKKWICWHLTFMEPWSIDCQTYGLYRFNRRSRDVFYHDRVRLWLLRVNNEYIMIFGTKELYIFRLFSSLWAVNGPKDHLPLGWSINDVTTRSIQGHVTKRSPYSFSTRDQTTLRSVFVYYWLWRQQRDSFIISIQDYRTDYPSLYEVRRTWSYRPPTHLFNRSPNPNLSVDIVPCIENRPINDQ